jgi:hypothetical protein
MVHSCEHGNEPLSSIRKWVISGLAEKLLAPQKWLCSQEWVSYKMYSVKIVVTYVIFNSMVQGVHWKVDCYSADQEIPKSCNWTLSWSSLLNLNLQIIMYYILFSCYLISPRAIYSPPQFVLRHFNHCSSLERPSLITVVTCTLCCTLAVKRWCLFILHLK